MFKITIDGKSVDVESIDIKTVASDNGTPQLPVEPQPEPKPLPPILDSGVFEEDLAEEQPKSTPSNPHIPKGISSVLDVEYLGAMRVFSRNEESNVSYSGGALGFNPINNSLFMAGNDNEDAIAELAITELSKSDNLLEIPNAETIQEFVPILDNSRNDKINGMFVYHDKLLVTSEIAYDASGNNLNNLQVFDVDNIADVPTFKHLEGGALIAGWISEIPANEQSKLGGKYLVGWSANHSINLRYSHGPSLAVFNPEDVINNNLYIPTDIKQVYPMEDGKLLVEGSHLVEESDVSPMWGTLSAARYGFIVPDSNIYMVVGRHAGIHTGVGYKIIKNGKPTPGSATYGDNDSYNYFWLYNIKDIANAENPWDVKPFSYGKWEMPFKQKEGGLAGIIGATFDVNKSILYINLSGAAKTGRFGLPPLVVAYKVEAK